MLPSIDYSDSLRRAVMLALALSEHDWGRMTLRLPGPCGLQRWCSSADMVLNAALDALEALAPDDPIDPIDPPGPPGPHDPRQDGLAEHAIDDLAAVSLAPACRVLVGQAGIGSYQALRMACALAGGGVAICTLAVASGTARGRDPALGPALRMLAQQVGAVLAPAVAHAMAPVANSVANSVTAPAPPASDDFQRLFESVPGLYLGLALPEYRIVAVSDSYLAATMTSRCAILGRRLFDVFPDDPAEPGAAAVAALAASLARVAHTGLPDAMGVQRYPIRRANSVTDDFEVRYWSPLNLPVRGADGALRYIIHSVQDVTDHVLSDRDASGAGPDARQREGDIALRAIELRRLARSLSLSEQRFDYVTRATGDVIWDWNIDSDLLWCSRGALEPIASALACCARMPDWQACIHADDRARIGASLHASVQARHQHWSAHYRMSLSDGSQCHVLHRALLVLDQYGRPQRMVGSIVDQTEHRRQQARLRLQAEMLDHATDAIIVCDLNNCVLYWNEAATMRYGWRSDEVLGRSLSDTLWSASPARELEHARALLMRQGDHVGRMLHTGASGQTFTVHVHSILVRREDGAPRAILSVVTDLSDQIALEQRLLQSEKLDALGRLTGGIAHDFNNWLTIIIGNAEELVDALDALDVVDTAPQLSEIAGMILKAGERGAQLTRRLLTFARRQPLEPHTFAIGPLVRELRDLIGPSLPENIDYRLLGAEHDWQIHADRPQLESAILNLVINARDAMPEGGCLTIALSLAVLDQDNPGMHQLLLPGQYVVIAVCDDGHGMSGAVLERVFEPFFTTKDAAFGSGLGLSMVYGFVRQSQGDVEVLSQEGHGTQVKILLPLAPGAGARASADRT